MKVTILGCGPACGVPSISRGWGACDSCNYKNARTRTSAFIEVKSNKILVDTGPDLRSQLISNHIKEINKVLYTHGHADHTHGIDELREVNRAMKSGLDMYASKDVIVELKSRFGYAFADNNNSETVLYRPWLNLHEVIENAPIELNDGISIKPLFMSHGWIGVVGYQFNKEFAYTTDVVEMSDEILSSLKNIKHWVVGCMTPQESPTHANIDKVLKWADIIEPENVYLTHMGLSMDYDWVNRNTPDFIHPCYDGMIIEVED